MTLTAGGNLFIGATSGSNTAGFTNRLYLEGNIPSLTLSNTGTNTGKYTLGVTNGNFGVWNNATSSYPIFISSSNNVLIGTTTDNGAKLQIGSAISGTPTTTPTAIQLDNTFKTGGDAFDKLKLFLYKDATQSYGFSVGDLSDLQYWSGTNASGQHRFFTSQTERLKINLNGTVQIGIRPDTTEATANLSLVNTNYSGYHWLDGTAYYIGQNSAFRSLRIYSGATSAVGVNLAAGGTSWGTYSDERLKENIENIDSVLPKLSSLRTVKYHLKNVDVKDSQKRYGIIAQDLIGKFDEAINLTKYSDEDETEYYNVKYTELIPVLIKAIQELNEKITQLENK
jgi:hypothetical protein